jgi:hypothetical protein
MKKHVLLIVVASLFTAMSFAQTTLVLQPGPADGKDAEIFSCIPCGYANTNYGNKKDFNAIAWTNGGNNSNVRSLIQFDLSGIPANATITSATLALYFNPTSDEGNHVKLLGSNTSYLERITSNWAENTVTWNTQPTTTSTNRVALPATTSGTQNFTNINVRQLIIDSRNNPNSSFGFMFKLQKESIYKKLIFASSDNPTASIRPRLTITYTTPSARVEEAISQNDFTVYPNPASGISFLKLNVEKETAASLQVYNTLGKLCFSNPVQLIAGANELSFDAGLFPSGIYIVAIKTEEQTFTKRVVVK